jgi:hypothetical protein
LRTLTNYSGSEWLQALPLKHALKQARNDVWLAAYLRRRAPLLDDFLRRNAVQKGRDVAMVIAFEQPWALGWLLDMAARHLQGTTVMVFDNSRRPEARQEIARVCSERGAPYLALPENRTTHVNRSHGMAMSWVHANVVRRLEPRFFAFLDHDLIPVRPLSLAERIGDQAFFGLPVHSAWAWQLWAGYCIYDFRRVGQVPMNFLYDFSQGLDTGGRNWRGLYRHHVRDSLRFAASEDVGVRASASGLPTAVQIIDGRWLHIGGISYNDNFVPKIEFCQRLALAFERGASWAQICDQGLGD